MMTEKKPTARDRRDQFLVTMYGKTWDNISRHLLVVWQSIAALFTAVGAAFLSDKKLLSPDFAFSIVVLAATWSLAHAIDAKAWFNRNLLIVSNIERQFLWSSDAQEIHPFFAGPHHSGFVDHLKIQVVLGWSILGLAIVFHFFSRVWGGLDPSAKLDPTRALPYACALMGAAVLWAFNRKVNTKYAALIKASPGGVLAPAEPVQPAAGVAQNP